MVYTECADIYLSFLFTFLLNRVSTYTEITPSIRVTLMRKTNGFGQQIQKRFKFPVDFNNIGIIFLLVIII